MASVPSIARKATSSSGPVRTYLWRHNRRTRQTPAALRGQPWLDWRWDKRYGLMLEESVDKSARRVRL